MSSVDEMLKRHDDAIYDLQQRLFSASGGGSNVFKDIIIDDGTNPVVVVGPTSAPATGLALAWGSSFSDIYVDVSWNAMALGTTYAVEYAIKTGPGAYSLVEVLGGVRVNSLRIHNLHPNTTYGFRVIPTNTVGVPAPTPAWTDIAIGTDTTIPAAITNVLIARGATSVIVKFDSAVDADVANGRGVYRIQISSDNFATVAREKLDTGTIVQFSDIPAESTNWKAKVSAIDESGNEGPQTTSSAYTAGGVIDSMLVGNFDAAHITFGTMAGDRIAANSADIAILKTSSLTSVTITLAGGAFRALGSGGGVGMLINSQGLSMYDTSAVRTIFFDASNGNGAFKGDVVATSGTLSTLTVTGRLMAGTVDIGRDVGGGTGYDGIALNHADWNNVFMRRASDGVYFFRVNNGGTNSITFDSSTGVLAITGAITATSGTFTGTVNANAGYLASLSITGTLSGGNITGTTITAGSFRTAASGSRLNIGAVKPAYIDFYPNGDEYAPGDIHGVVSGTDRIVYVTSPQQDSGYGYARMYVIGKPTGDSNAHLEGNNIYLRKPGPAAAAYVEINGTQVQIYSNGTTRMNYSVTEGTTSNGTQDTQGFVLYGNKATAMGGNPAYGIGLRAYADGTFFEVDTFWTLYCRQGLSTTGSKTFEIDHPVLGDDYYLTFSSIEGPRADLIYRGVVTLDKKGHADVDIDAEYGMSAGTFDALNFADRRQAFLFNESGGQTPSYSLAHGILAIDGKGGDTVGWMVVTERGDASMLHMKNTDNLGHIRNERKKTEWDKVTSSQVLGPVVEPHVKRPPTDQEKKNSRRERPLRSVKARGEMKLPSA